MNIGTSLTKDTQRSWRPSSFCRSQTRGRISLFPRLALTPHPLTVCSFISSIIPRAAAFVPSMTSPPMPSCVFHPLPFSCDPQSLLSFRTLLLSGLRFIPSMSPPQITIAPFFCISYLRTFPPTPIPFARRTMLTLSPRSTFLSRVLFAPHHASLQRPGYSYNRG